MINENSYICYNWFPIIAEHILDVEESFYRQAGVSRLHQASIFQPESVKKGDIVFVKTDFIYNGYFQNNLLDRITNPFILVSGISSFHIGSNGDLSYKKILENPNLIKWFCTNPPFDINDKIVPLPIGFEEYEREGGNQNFINYMRLSRIPFEQKKNKILLPYHNFSTNIKRKELYDLLSTNEFVEVQKEKLSFQEYMKLLNEYKFIICLEGAGPDVHRNYESLLLDCVPINISNNIEKLFKYYELPGIFLKSWDTLNFENLNDIIEQKSFDNIEKFLNIGFHIENIMKVKNEN